MPPHSTQTLQPLDVVCFKSLSSHYSNELDDYLQQTQGLSPLEKADFFNLFWPAWVSTFTSDLVERAFKATGISPVDPTRSSLKELDLPRAILARLLSIRTRHGDFAWYHRKYNHKDANLTCSCRQDKTPEHLALCRKTLGSFSRWPLRPPIPPFSQADGIAYTAALTREPEAFEAFIRLTQYYIRICPR